MIRVYLESGSKKYLDGRPLFMVYEMVMHVSGETIKMTDMVPIVKEQGVYKIGITSELTATFKQLKIRFK